MSEIATMGTAAPFDAGRTPCPQGGEDRCTKDEWCLYVLELVGFGVKVGISKSPRRRLEVLRKHAKNHGFSAGQTFVSAPHIEAQANEKHLIALLGSGRRREYLEGVSWDEATEAAAGLPKTRTSAIVRENEERERDEYVSFFWPVGTTKADIRRMVEVLR